LNGIVRDLGNIIGSIITFLMFITPVMYAKPKTGFLRTFTKFNPLYYLVDVPRNLILTGNFYERSGFTLSVCLSLFIFFTCWIIFYLTETRVAERI
jgi:lipopolysaccharide transport system permease protein